MERGESLAAAERLRRRSEYLRCYRRGRRRRGRLLTLYAVGNDLGHPRLGITASRKVGGAVVRQRLRRRVREIYRRWEGRWEMPSLDVVVHLHPSAREAGFWTLREELLERLSSLSRRRGS